MTLISITEELNIEKKQIIDLIIGNEENKIKDLQLNIHLIWGKLWLEMAKEFCMI